MDQLQHYLERESESVVSKALTYIRLNATGPADDVQCMGHGSQKVLMIVGITMLIRRHA